MTTHDDDESGVILSDHCASRLGRLDRPKKRPSCTKCGSARVTRIDRYDAMACRSCDVWLEAACSDDCDVGLCTGRPATPHGCNWDDENNTHYGVEASK